MEGRFLITGPPGKSPEELLLREFFVLFLQCFCKVEIFFQNINKKIWVPSTPWALTASRSASHCSDPCMHINPLTPHSQCEAGLTLVPGPLTGKLRPGLGFGLGTTCWPPAGQQMVLHHLPGTLSANPVQQNDLRGPLPRMRSSWHLPAQKHFPVAREATRNLLTLPSC